MLKQNLAFRGLIISKKARLNANTFQQIAAYVPYEKTTKSLEALLFSIAHRIGRAQDTFVATISLPSSSRADLFGPLAHRVQPASSHKHTRHHVDQADEQRQERCPFFRNSKHDGLDVKLDKDAGNAHL